jgi:hypothetical protein
MTDSPHFIRLRAAWQRDNGSDWERCNLPDRLEASSGQCVHYGRTFNCPTGLEAGQRVWLVFEGWQGLMYVLLDGQLLAARIEPQSAPWQHEITRLLSGSHRLEVRLERTEATSPMGLTGLVSLRIDPA